MKLSQQLGMVLIVLGFVALHFNCIWEACWCALMSLWFVNYSIAKETK